MHEMRLFLIGASTLAGNSVMVDVEQLLRTRYGSLVVVTLVLILFLSLVLVVLLRKEAARRKAADRAAERRLRFSRLLSDTTARVANAGPENIAQEVKRGLQALRDHVAVDQTSMFYVTESDGGLQGISCSAAGVVDPAIPALQVDTSSWLGAQLTSGKSVLIQNVGLLSMEAGAERLALTQQGIRSAAIIPITTDGSVNGFIMLSATTEQRGWPQELTWEVQTMGDVLYLAYRRQKAESKIREMEERFVLTADNAPVMIWMSGTDKLCTYFNQGWLSFTGRTIEQEMGNGWLQSVHPADAAQCIADYLQAFDARRRFRLEYRMRRFDGDYRWIIDYGTPRFEPGGVFCGYIGSCIDVTELKRSEQELKQLSAQLIHAQEDERKRIARELHDDFSQQLTLLGLELAKLNLNPNREASIEQFVRDLEGRIRELSRAMNNRAHQLHCSHLETLGLPSAIQGLCNDFARQHDMTVDFRENGPVPKIPPNISLCLFRIVQEGLQNVAKHSHTKKCWVELTPVHESLVLRIVDAGIGFDPASPRNKSGLGLISMRERLRLVHGVIRLNSAPQQGTRLEIWVPLQQKSTAA